MKSMICWACVAIPTFIAAGHVVAQEGQPVRQETPPAPAAPKTKMEQFMGAHGSVIIRGYTSVGKVTTPYGTVSVDARTFRSATTADETKGVVVEIKPAGAYSRSSRSFVDYDEVSGLLEGIDYVSRIDRSATKLAEFEAVYRTRGDLAITVFSSGSITKAAIQTGSLSSESIFMDMQQLGQVRKLIVQAKYILDNPDAPEAKGLRPPNPAAAAQTSQPAAAPPNSQPVAPAKPPAPKPSAAGAAPTPKPADLAPLR